MNRLSEPIPKFLSGERLTGEEFASLSKLLNDACYQQVLALWLEENWQQSREEIVLLEFEQLKKQIRTLSLKSKAKR